MFNVKCLQKYGLNSKVWEKKNIPVYMGARMLGNVC